MNILTNIINHDDNAYSLYSLFEKRLGHKLFLPFQDKEWEKIGITGQSVGRRPVVASKSYWKDGIKYVPIFHGPAIRRMITAEYFLDMDFGMVVVTTRPAEIMYAELIRKYKPNCILVRQIGQIGETPAVAKNALMGKKTVLGEDINRIIYHPEHPPVYEYVPYAGEGMKIKSFSNYLRLHKKVVKVWDEAKQKLPEFDFFMHGSRTDDRDILPYELHHSMKDSMFIWHTKLHGGDGFVCTEALGCGRPMIVNKRWTKSWKTLAEDYLEDGVNCIDIDPAVRPLNEAIKIIKRWAHPDMYEKKCQDVIKCFNKHFNFEKEADQIKDWIQTLKPGVQE